ncbi:MAG TPA: adenylate/guanylate cyclase domain-containing protein [Chitinophagaceae bacterium]
MFFRKLLNFRLRTLIGISLVWMVFGFIFFFNLVNGNNDLGIKVDLWKFIIIFGIIGCIINAALIFFFKNAFNNHPTWISILLKLLLTSLLFLLVSFLILAVYYIFRYRHGNVEHFVNSFFTKVLFTKTFLIFIVDLAVMSLLSIVLIDITHKYGPGMFWSMMIGQYNNPKIENRIFVFLDINSATTIAEHLGHEQYFRLLKNFFYDITIPVLTNDGMIYQYVGDEIVISWLNTSENKIKALKFIRNAFFLLKRREDKYLHKYGTAPDFKAGLHAGEVTAGFVGEIKKDLIYSGDTMNTAARIRSMCNELNELFVLSEDFMEDFHQPFGYEIAKIGTMELKGRTEPIKLFSLNFE